MRPIELLAPAKDAAHGIEAIRHGADAVYIGAPRYGARAAAGNTIKDIASLVGYAHLYKAKVYVALNTLFYDQELDDAGQLTKQLYNAGIDALIIQDMGLLELDLPPVPLFASTQTHNSDLAKVTFLEKAGFSRVILSRELSLSEIINIRAQTRIDLEAFVHGALCVSYSGQCYLSQHLANRSANRGVCAQPCRSSWQLTDKQGNLLINNHHLLSLKDLNLSGHLRDLLDAGITSFKIEGRLKDMAYVKNITSWYRQALDRILETDHALERSSVGRTTWYFDPDPEKTFNRGYTPYFLSGPNAECGSPLTQKSLGKKIGVLEAKKGDRLMIRSHENILPGDGLCYFGASGILEGFLVNQSDGLWCTPAKEVNIPPGTTVYRNLDSAFIKLLHKHSADRKIGTTMHLTSHPGGCALTVTDEENLSVTSLHELPPDEARNKQLAHDHIVKQLSRLGETPFYLTQPVRVDASICRFFPAATLNEMRREVLQMLTEKRTLSIHHPTIPVRSDFSYPQQAMDYRGNVLNQKARDFYQRHGVTQIQPGWEFKPPQGQAVLMTTRYCIRAQHRECLKTNPDSLWTEPLFLKDGNKTFRLIFDCALCQMHVVTGEVQPGIHQKGR